MPTPHGVQLPEGLSGSAFLHELLQHAVGAFPDAFATVAVPDDARAFKGSFATVLPHFEAARAASPRRAEIARALRHRAGTRLRYVDEDGERPLRELFDGTARPLETVAVPTRGPGRLTPRVPFEGEAVEGAALADLAEHWRARHWMTPASLEALERLLARAEADGGTLSLAGHRFAMLGAGAELAPTALLLEAGADVLWIDLRPPPDALLARDDLGGTLHVPREPADLLRAPHRIAATVAAFATKPVHVGMYAYMGGQSQERRLTASMNAILRTQPAEAVRSMALLISPTTTMRVAPEDHEAAVTRAAEAVAWKRLLRRLGALDDGQVPSGDRHVSRSIVPIQGASYQAAQYVGKVLASEAHAVYGSALADGAVPLTVSANVAPITRTRSLAHPVFEAAFLGAPAWHIHISDPATTAALNGLLMVHDVTDPDAPGAARRHPTAAERADEVHRQQVHGGVFAQPYTLEGGIRVAALMGLAQRPSLVRGLLPGRS